MDYISPIREQLNESMHSICRIFMLIGCPNETPRYFNFRDFNIDTKILRIGSTQVCIYFDIKTNFRHVDVTTFWGQFKEYRTDFLQQNYPSINPF